MNENNNRSGNSHRVSIHHRYFVQFFEQFLPTQCDTLRKKWRRNKTIDKKRDGHVTNMDAAMRKRWMHLLFDRLSVSFALKLWIHQYAIIHSWRRALAFHSALSTFQSMNKQNLQTFATTLQLKWISCYFLWMNEHNGDSMAGSVDNTI